MVNSFHMDLPSPRSLWKRPVLLTFPWKCLSYYYLRKYWSWITLQWSFLVSSLCCTGYYFNVSIVSSFGHVHSTQYDFFFKTFQSQVWMSAWLLWGVSRLFYLPIAMLEIHYSGYGTLRFWSFWYERNILVNVLNGHCTSTRSLMSLCIHVILGGLAQLFICIRCAENFDDRTASMHLTR